MNSVGSNCNELKQEYDACFNVWFGTQFLKGNNNESMCAPILKLYTECVKEAIKELKIDLKEIERNVLHTEEEKKKPGES
ncbi:hypothetical protein FOCC_FOCC007583 [Frankliniella occidentalis]|uniref:TP53-regulated inhibitor of apoptosis 1 n=1 Tax=Frankliniella occidentalis TaxID=133901 RepID=A0A6J1SSL5_FRAOC|nr:TP53-regulated inhibitor of apoptosis 1 [Frankliniella occidentalis]XP_026281497.1 TP53-regulated inhibitor of apoptosis 1 [Frankliniella occidentalis]KAE8745699.1 hypothetical protein FOCC_FOCC007583 [Frankliniella occidentalis]